MIRHPPGQSPLFLSSPLHLCSVASVFPSVCDVFKGGGGSFVQRIVSLLVRQTESPVLRSLWQRSW